jgi:hypothetical protein
MANNEHFVGEPTFLGKRRESMAVTREQHDCLGAVVLFIDMKDLTVRRAEVETNDHCHMKS